MGLSTEEQSPEQGRPLESDELSLSSAIAYADEQKAKLNRMLAIEQESPALWSVVREKMADIERATRGFEQFAKEASRAKGHRELLDILTSLIAYQRQEVDGIKVQLATSPKPGLENLRITKENSLRDIEAARNLYKDFLIAKIEQRLKN